jgi:integrase
VTTVDANRRKKDYLSEAEFEQLLKGVKCNRNSTRDSALLLLMYRHGLRVSEACTTRKDSVDLRTGRIHCSRRKGGNDSEHPLTGRELRAIKAYLKTREDSLPWLFISERMQPIDRRTVYLIIRDAGKRAGLGRVWPHMLRHSCGYRLANQGSDTRLIQDYLGHKDANMTAKYTRTAAKRFEGLWKD